MQSTAAMRPWIRWRLVVTTLPFVAVMIGLGLVRDAIGLQGLFELGDIAAILWKSPASDCTLLGFITLVHACMVRLIRDVDCPFDHGRDGARGSAEVDLSPVPDYLTRARRRLETTAGQASIRIA